MISLSKLKQKHIIFFSIIVLLLIIIKLILMYYFYNSSYSEYFTNSSRIIVSLTTSPTRLDKVHKVIENISNQTLKPTKIYLNIPHFFKRNGESYNSDLIKRLESQYPLLQINRCEDKGPITKLYPTLEIEKNPETMIIILDDDMEYEDKLIEKLVTQFRKDQSIVLSNDVNIYATVEGIDTPGAYAGIIFTRKMFQDDFYDFIYQTGMYKHCYNSDDLIIGLYLKKHGIKVKQAEILGTNKESDYQGGDDALKRQDNIYHNERYQKCKKFIDTML